jgi:phosphoenolpyruvate phosphomutase
MKMRLRIQPESRRNLVRSKLSNGEMLRLIEAHSGLSARVAVNSVGECGRQFDGVWVSSLTSSATRGLPDIELHTLENRIDLVREIMFAINIPVVVDVDTGGETSALAFFCQKLETIGVSAVIVEDKVYPKRNSFSGTNICSLEDPKQFAKKISKAKSVLHSDEMMIVARIEALVAGSTMADALNRAQIYVDAGADGIMIHSKSKNAEEVLEFSRRFKEIKTKNGQKVPLVCVPTTYSGATADTLFSSGFSMVIYANHLLRSSLKAMRDACSSILDNDSSVEIESQIATIPEVFEITDYFLAVEADS